MTALSFRPTLSSPAAVRAPRAGVARMFAVWRQRRALSELAPERLADLGLTREQVRIESARPMWDVPAGWLR